MKLVKMYEVGDKVRIKSHLTIGDDKYGVFVTASMVKASGKIATVVGARLDYDRDADFGSYGAYTLEIDGITSELTWTDDEFDSDETVAKFMPKDLKTGMFGETDDGDRFVVVDDILVFKNGSYQPISDFDDDLCSGHYYIMKVKTDCTSFMQYAASDCGTVIYDRRWTNENY